MRCKPKCTQHEAPQSGTENEAELLWRNVQRSRHRRSGYADGQKVESVEKRDETAQHDDLDLCPIREILRKQKNTSVILGEVTGADKAASLRHC